MSETRDDDHFRSKYSRELARKLLTDSGIFKPPIHVEEIASKNGFTVAFIEGEANSFSGILQRDMKAIGVNKDHPSARQRFTIAHELGHYYLDHIQEDEQLLTSPDSNGWKNCEREANEFAGELLVPLQLLKIECDRIKHIAIDKKLGELAKIFLVSREVITIQLTKHKLLSKL